ncbi:hypothetical protein A3718_08330 [Erythrobacter sp. HI0019]|nr:hypothetical protein A3718_08330 [Erythrobacter sp. HI0019]KZY09651.1 hypothetical protein A3723_09250 [Erythrobacter sp. HI0028]
MGASYVKSHLHQLPAHPIFISGATQSYIALRYCYCCFVRNQQCRTEPVGFVFKGGVEMPFAVLPTQGVRRVQQQQMAQLMHDIGSAPRWRMPIVVDDDALRSDTDGDR